MSSPPKLAPLSLGPTLTIGEILVEMMSTTAGHGMAEAQNFRGPFPSGAPAIFCDQSARLGCPTAMIGAVGRDDFGESCLTRLTKDGVDCSAVAQIDSLPTGVAFVRYQSSGTRAFIYNIAPSAAGQIRLTPQTRAMIASAGHLHIMGSSLTIDAALPVIEFALEIICRKGGTVSFDPNMRPELLKDADDNGLFARILEQTNIFLPSGDEVQLLGEAPSDDPTFAIRNWVAGGPRECVVKQGKDGATVYRLGTTESQTGIPTVEVDPTGAGDCFGATYVACRRMGMDLSVALKYANVAGSRAVTQLGPMEGTSSFAELDAAMW